MFANWARANEPTSAVHVFECQFFSSNCRKFAVECAGISKISQNVQNLGFFKMVFAKKLDFLKIAAGSKFAVECVYFGNISWKCVFSPHYEVHLAKKKQKTLNVGEIKKYDEKSVF